MSEEFKTWEEMTRKEQLECIFWDAYKDAHGFRPRHINVRAMSESELEAELEVLGREIDAQEVQRRADEAEAVEKFEKRVADTILMGAVNRDTALRWIMDGSEAQGDWEYFCYLNGLPYGYFRKIA